jgi:hypothetical protein
MNLKGQNDIVARRYTPRIVAACALLLLGRMSTAVAESSQQEIIKDFESRVKNYLVLRQNDAGKSPRPTSSPDKLEAKTEDLAAKVKALRSDAKQGDIFTPAIAKYFRAQISATLKSPEGHKIRASLQNAEPVRGLALHVNQVYPQGIPVQSTPPTLLLNLPTLPSELEYRIVDHALVLHDTAPNIVVDFISDAIPSD